MAEEILPAPLPTASVPALQTLDQFMLAALAREVAMAIKDLPVVLEGYNLTPERYESVKAIPFYAACLEQFTREWHSAQNTPDRVKLEAAAFFEEWMPTLYGRMKNTGENLAQVVEGGKLIARIAGLGERAAGSESGTFQLTINLGGDEQLKITAPVIEARSE